MNSGKKSNFFKKKIKYLCYVLLFGIATGGSLLLYDLKNGNSGSEDIAYFTYESKLSEAFSLENVPEYFGSPYVIVNENVPFFSEEDCVITPFEYYSELDGLGRCGVAYANVCRELMPTEERGKIGMIKPSGWQNVKYDFVDGKYLYNRCHLIGYQLAGENANEKNLITGTRYMNVNGMLPFENMVDAYVEETGNHVLYRVTPVFEGENLLAAGVLMEARSVEDAGEGICYNVFVYNVEPGVEIDYKTGESREVNRAEQVTSDNMKIYVLNTHTKKFHLPECDSVKEMSEKNRQIFEGDRIEVINQGYSPCKNCNP